MTFVEKNSLISIGGERRLPNMYPDYTSIETGCVMKRLKYVLPYIKRDFKILDLGCGAGWQTKYVSLYCKHIVGLDINNEGLKIAQELNNAMNITWCQNSMDNLKVFGNGEFDFIMSTAAIEHINKQGMRRMFKELHRVSKENSMFVGTTTKFHSIGKENATKWHLYEPGKGDFHTIMNPWYSIIKMENFKLDTPDLKCAVVEGVFILKRNTL